MKINLEIKIKCEFTFIFMPEIAAESECFLSGSLSLLWEMESLLEEEKKNRKVGKITKLFVAWKEF